MRIIKYTVPDEFDGRTIRSLLSGQLGCSGTMLKRLKQRPGSVCCDGVPSARLNLRVGAGTQLSVDVDDPEPIPKNAVCAVPILYEDEDILILDKPAGMAVHPAGMTAYKGTLAEAVGAYLGGRMLHCVNRLDRGTSGLMAVAKSAYVHELLRKNLHTDNFYREYRAIVCGRPAPSDDTIERPIAREKDSAIRRCVSPEGAPSVTRYETMDTAGEYSLLRVIPETGRTHQIRVHMASIGFPLAGDWLYGHEDPKLGRPALHSCRIEMKNPLTGQTIRVSSPIPPDMASFWTELKSKNT